MGLLDKLQSKLEVYRLEQKYTRRKNRSTFTTGAQYVDGEYVFTNEPMSASSTGSTERSMGAGLGMGGAGKRRSLWVPPRSG